MKNLRPPIRDYTSSSNTDANKPPSRPRPPMGNQNQNSSNTENSSNKPPTRPGPQFSNPNQNNYSNNNNNNFNNKNFNNNNNNFSNNNNYNQQNQNNYNQNNQNNYNQQNQQNQQNQKNQQQSDSDSQKDDEVNEQKTPKHKTSQKHKSAPSSYSINPNQIPRPNQADEVYVNNEKTPIYQTNVGSPPPHSTTFYSVKETQNTSCRFLRSSMNFIPDSQSLLNETSLIFGICVQPFAEIPDYEEPIPKVETGDNIFRCKQCKSYINNKYNITYSAQNKQIAICNLCQYENEFDSTKSGVKSDYFNSDFSTCPELVKPTIDFIAPTNFKSSKLFVPHYLFMIDISENSYQLGLPFYVINSIQANLESFDNAENTFIGFALYDHKNIYFFYYEKNDIRLSIMGDIKDPFCPISMKKIFINITQKREDIDKLIERLNAFIDEKNSNVNNNVNRAKRQISTITGCAMKSGVESLLENGGRVMIFTPNPCSHGFGACAPRETFDKEKEPRKANPYYPQHELFIEIAEKAVNHRIVVDQFIFMSQNYDLSTFSIMSNLTGGHVEYYNYTADQSTVNSMYEKLHYDLTRIVTRPNYYDCKFMLRFTVGVDCVEILGPFNKKLGEAFQLGGCDPDYCYFYNMRFNESFKSGQKVDIQLVVLFDDNYSNRYLRIFNTSFEVTTEVSKIFNNCEVDAMTKAMIYKEISLIYKTDFKNVRENLENKIINSFKYYRVKEKSGTPSNQLILPISIRYMPLYIDSFLKTGILSNQNKPEMINQVIYILNKLLRDPIYGSMKFLYPKFYRIDDIQDKQISNNGTKIENIGLINEKYNIIQKPLLLRLSKDVIDFDCAYMIDDGCYIYIFIFNHIEGNFYNDVFGVSSFEEAKNLGVTTLDEENQSDLNQRLINIVNQLRKENSGHFQPIRMFFFEEKNIVTNSLTSLLKEDKIDEYENYPSYLCNIHREIQNRIMG